MSAIFAKRRPSSLQARTSLAWTAMAMAAATAVLGLGGPLAPGGVASASSLGAPPTGRSLAPCHAPGSRGPGYDASVGLAQNGKSVCVKVGEKLLVFLRAPNPGANNWGRVMASPTGLLMPAPLTLMLGRGVTGANFKAVRPGTVRLSSQRAACPPAKPGAVACNAIELWRVTVFIEPV